MDYSKINQTELNYSSGAGEAKVNLYTGRLALEHQLCSIGRNSYELTLSLIHNSHLELPTIFASNLGSKWKFNIQQYVYKEGNKYYYFDGTGMKIEFNNAALNVYYDVVGLGLQLTEDNENEVTIKDPANNEMKFLNGRLTSSTSNVNINICKKYEYIEDKLSVIYDTRKPDNKITFEYYENGFVKFINVYLKNTLKYKYKFYYEDNNLISINKEQNYFEKVYLLYSYQNNLLRYAIYVKNRSAHKFEYSDNKITSVNTGVATLEEDNSMQNKYYVGDDIYVGEDLYVGEKIAVEKYKIIESMNTFTDGLLKSNTIEYCENYRTVTNEASLKFVYYLNDNGFTTSILEVNSSNGDMNDLRTLERMPGIEMMNVLVDNGTERINQKKPYLINTATKLSTDSTEGMYLVDTFEKLKSYREHDCSNYINYVCSFWLKAMTSINNNRIKIRIKSGNVIESFYATFDETALNSWQEVRIPIRIPDKILKEITISFNDNNSQHYVKVADMKLYDSGTNQIMIGNDNYNCSLNEISNVIYYSYDDNTEEQEKTLGYSTYMTEKDLQMTYLYKYKLSLQPNAELSGYFPLFYNDCTKFVMVNSASFKDGEDNVYSLDFVDDFLEEDKYLFYSRTNYFLQSCSPDGDLRTNQKTYFVQSYNIDGETYNCMIQKTEVDLYDEEAAKHKESYILNCTDFNGKTLLEQDEYGVQNIYKYNGYGDIINKIITSKSGTTRIEETINYDNNVQTNENDVTKSTTYYDNFDNIYKTELLGKNEAESNKLTNEYTYNYFNDSIQKVNNNLNGNNFIKYDSMGRITSISPRKETDSNYYGYKFKYDEFGDPVNFSFEYRDEATNKLVENTLVERNKQRTVGETIVNTYLYEEKDNPVCKTNVIDKYGRNFAIVNGEKDVTFKYQNIVESQGAANIMEMYDSEDSKIHYYKYNEDNNLIEYGYGYLDTNNGNSLSEDGYKILDESKGYLNIKKTSEDITELTFQNDNNGCEKIILETSVSKDPEKLLSPRIQFNSGRFKFQPNSDTISYSYDDIGRINVKTMGVHNRWSASDDSSNNSTTLNFIKEIKYCPNSNLIENIKTTNIVLSETKNTIDQIYSYNNKGEIESNNTSFTNGDEKVRKYITNYSYNQASRITSETFKYIDENDNTSTKVFNYTYNDDGSLDSVTENGITKQYYYNKGRLSKVRENNIEYNLTYDNLGNTLTFGSNTYTYVRGNLLSTLNNGNNNFKYYYNGQGKKYKKELPNGEVITYVYDNEKLISEKNSNGKELIYLYDMTGIYGILVNNNGSYLPEGNCYYFEKDILGNVISINDGINEIAHYTYDAFGNCNVINYTNLNIGDINPIRWKSMYCEVESNLYFINNNTYSPELRQTLSMNYLDEIINNSLIVNNLYAYNIYSTNPVALIYEEYTIESALHLTYEPPQKSKCEKFWDSLWNRWWGKVIAVSLTAISFVVTAVFAPCMLPTFLFTLASVGVTLIAGGVIAGILSAQRGKGFWNGFFNYINENWAQTLAIEMAMYLVSFGVTQALGIGTKCFIEGTLILTSVGLVKIEDIKEGDEVWSYNEETKEKELKKVKRLFRNKTKEWLHLTILNEETKKEEEIICTKKHRIYIKNKGWIPANEILENEEVLLYNNVIGKVIRKELENLTYEETTYNFEVEDNHNYYVGEECVLVHNAGCKTNKEIKEMAKKINYKQANGLSNGELVFKNSKAPRNLRYISFDNTSHNGGVWKAAKSIRDLGSKSTRTGTFDDLMRWIHE